MRFAAAFAAVLLAAATGCGGRDTSGPRRPGRSIVLVTLDTFRADHLGCAGHPSIRTPHLDRVARRGIQWSQVVSAIPLTTPSHATILTGMTPRAHGLLKNRMALDTTRVTVAEVLAAAGFRTAAIVSNRTVLGPDLGLDQGFATYRVIEPAKVPASGEGRETAAAAGEILAKETGPGLFLWAHFFDAHLPYVPPPPFDRLHAAGGAPRDTASLYMGEVEFLDGCIGEVARAIDASGAAAHTVLVVTADHGEGLGEHGGYVGHDIQLYETSVRVPLLVAGAGIEAGREHAAPRVIPELARTTDLATTILGLAGLPEAERPRTEGRDLLHDPALVEDGLSFVSETHPASEKASPLYAMRTPFEKVIWDPRHGRREMYELETDPGETRDLVKSPTDPLFFLSQDLELDLRNRPVGRTQTVDDLRGGPDAATREALESLGYVGD